MILRSRCTTGVQIVTAVEKLVGLVCADAMPAVESSVCAFESTVLSLMCSRFVVLMKRAHGRLLRCESIKRLA